MTTIRTLARRLLVPWISPEGYATISRLANPKKPPGFPFLRLDDFLEVFARRHRTKAPFFVLIGANDGVRNDWLFPYVCRYRWQGILVEPLPTYFGRLRANYAAHRNLAFENVGISAENGSLDFFHLPEEHNEPPWLQQIGSFDRRAIEFNLAGHPHLISNITTCRIPTITFQALLDRHKVQRIDLLLVDTEGYERVILKQLETATVRPRYIIFEWGCMREDDLADLTTFLRERAYELFSCGGDLLAVSRSR